MKIFVRGLPRETSPSSLQAFAEHILTPPWYLPLRKKILVKNFHVLRIKDLDLHTTEYHGILEITPYKAAKEAIKRINNQSFHGRLLKARPWHQRSTQNEVFTTSQEPMEQGAKIPPNRRRPNLVVETYTPPDFQGLKNFHRVLT